LIQSDPLSNPFPGLRPFEPDEDHLFFGREKETDELLRRLRETRFLQVVGTSGSGKSSLVRSGLVPALQSGFMVGAGSSWRFLIFRPGEDPIGHLAGSLDTPNALGTGEELASTNRVMLEATLRRGALGLVEAVRYARIPPHDNLLVVVDQFEELFRFRRVDRSSDSRDEAAAFFKLLLEAVEQDTLPIYVVLTMRADFIGNCMEFQGLPEAVDAGMYLVPRMTREELRSAITGPIAVRGGKIAERLVLRLLNDIGDNHDQLPLLQHALMRTWHHWASHRQTGKGIDIPDYEAIGTLHQALSLHADEAYDDAGLERNKQMAERVFKSLTDTFSDPWGVRRPTSVKELAAICQASEEEVIQVIETFRRPGRSFLTPSAGTPLDSNSIIDISHESLMRCWTRLIKWAEEERESAASYVRIAQAALWCEECTGGLWTDPQLETGLQWRRKNQPTAAWAERYEFHFAEAMEFLDRSEKARTAELGKARKRKLISQIVSYVLAILLLIVGTLFYMVRKQKDLAEHNLSLAKLAVDESLASAGREHAREAADLPEMEEFRRELLDKAKTFYLNFAKQEPRNEELRGEIAKARSRLGDVYRLLDMHENAVKEYKEAISEFGNLVREHPRNVQYRRMLAYSHNWLAETLRNWLEEADGAMPHTSSEAENEYNAALRLQQELSNEEPKNNIYQQELARTYYNRGILLYDRGLSDTAKADFRAAIRLLEPLVTNSVSAKEDQDKNPPAKQELARAYNNMGNLMMVESRLPEAEKYFESAISIHQQLMKEMPNKREYKLEFGQFAEGLAGLFLEEKHFAAASLRNQQALDIFEELATPSHSLGIERIKAHLLRSRIAESEHLRDALTESDHALQILSQLKKYQKADSHSAYNVLYMHLAYNYLGIARKNLEVGSLEDARIALEKVPGLLPNVPSQNRKSVEELYAQLHGEWSRETVKKSRN
jgi:tetratricopeptide (TPR) repeat protein